MIKTTAKIVRLKRHTREEWVSGVGESAVFRTLDLGWWMMLGGSHEMMFVGDEKPTDFEVGDEIEVVFRKRRGV